MIKLMIVMLIIGLTYNNDSVLFWVKIVCETSAHSNALTIAGHPITGKDQR